jgi:hypothetical protein
MRPIDKACDFSAEAKGPNEANVMLQLEVRARIRAAHEKYLEKVPLVYDHVHQPLRAVSCRCLLLFNYSFTRK